MSRLIYFFCLLAASIAIFYTLFYHSPEQSKAPKPAPTETSAASPHPPADTRVVKGTKIPYELFYNDQHWEIVPSDEGGVNYIITLKGKPAGGTITEDPTVFSYDPIRKELLEGFNSEGMKSRIIEDELITINGVELLSLKVEVNAENGLFFAYGAYYTSEEGSLQILSIADKELDSLHRKRFEELINGFVLTD